MLGHCSREWRFCQASVLSFPESNPLRLGRTADAAAVGLPGGPIGPPLVPPAWQCPRSQCLPLASPCPEGGSSQGLGLLRRDPWQKRPWHTPQEGSYKVAKASAKMGKGSSGQSPGPRKAPPHSITPPNRSLCRVRWPRTLWLCWCPTATAAADCACRCVLTYERKANVLRTGWDRGEWVGETNSLPLTCIRVFSEAPGASSRLGLQ